MKTWLMQNKIVLAVTAVVVAAVAVVVSRVHIPGHIDVITAQAMDMSQMRPPVGAALVRLQAVRSGSISDVVTYTGTIVPYNEQSIDARVTGDILSLPVYPGDTVRAGQVVAQLDASELAPKTAEAVAGAQSAQEAAVIAHLTHHLHHQAALDQANAQVDESRSALANAQEQAQTATDAIAGAKAGVLSDQANQQYWAAEIAREKTLAQAGAVSQQEYQSELAKSQAAADSLAQSQSRLREAVSAAAAATSQVRESGAGVAAAKASEQMARADIAIAEGQAQQAEIEAVGAGAAAQQAEVVQGYTRIVAPDNGVVVARPVSPGTLVQPGDTILKIAEIDHVRVQANVAVADLEGVHPGSPVVILPDGAASSKPFLASVTAVFPSANPETRTAIVEADVPNPGHSLLPGEFVTMKIARASYSDKLLVPAAAVVTQGGQSYVWKAAASGAQTTLYECVICHIRYSAAQAKLYGYHDPMDGGRLIPVAPAASGTGSHMAVQRVAITLGASNGKWTQVLSGLLAPGDRVVVQGQAGLSDGAAVTAGA